MGLLDGITIMTRLVEQDGYTWEEARECWQEMEKANLEPLSIHEKVADQMGCTPEEARDHMERWDKIAETMFHVGNELARDELH
jgi:hypothetical protein